MGASEYACVQIIQGALKLSDEVRSSARDSSGCASAVRWNQLTDTCMCYSKTYSHEWVRIVKTAP